MNELSTQVQDHVIIFHDGARKFITKQQAALLFQNPSKTITTPQLGFISMPSIARIIEIEEFYSQFPDERPEYRPEFKPEPRETYKSIEEQSLGDVRRRSGLVRGLQLVIDEEDAKGRPAMNAREILEKWQKGERQNGGDNRSYHQKTVDKYKDKVRTPSEETHYQHAVQKLKELNVMV